MNFTKIHLYIFNFKEVEIKLKVSIFIISILCLVFVKMHFSKYLGPQSYGWGGIIKSGKKIDMLFIGSSHTRQSYDMKVIEKSCKCNPYLFAYSGMGPGFIYIALKYIVEEMKLRPSQIIIEAYPTKILSSPQIYDDRVFQFAPYKVKKEIINYLNKNRGKELNFSEYIQLFLTGRNETLLLSLFTNLILNKYSYKGSYQNKFMSSVSIEDFNNFPKNLKKVSDTKPVKAVILKQYQNIVKLLKRNQIPFIFIDPPLPSNIRSAEISKETERILRESLSSEKIQYYVPWKNRIGFNNDHKNFNDWNHLSTTGRSLYTKDIATLLYNIRK